MSNGDFQRGAVTGRLGMVLGAGISALLSAWLMPKFAKWTGIGKSWPKKRWALLGAGMSVGTAAVNNKRATGEMFPDQETMRAWSEQVGIRSIFRSREEEEVVQEMTNGGAAPPAPPTEVAPSSSNETIRIQANFDAQGAEFIPASALGKLPAGHPITILERALEVAGRRMGEALVSAGGITGALTAGPPPGAAEMYQELKTLLKAARVRAVTAASNLQLAQDTTGLGARWRAALRDCDGMIEAMDMGLSALSQQQQQPGVQGIGSYFYV